MSSKNKIYLNCSVSLIASGLLVWFLVAPCWQQIAQNVQELTEEESNLALLNSQLDVFEDFQSKKEQYQNYLLLIESFFIQADAPIGFMEFLESAAQLLNLKLTISAFGPDKDLKYSAGFKAQIEGGFPAALMFLERLEQGPWLVEISKVSINRFTESAGRPSESGLKDGDVILTIDLKSIARSLIQSQSNIK